MIVELFCCWMTGSMNGDAGKAFQKNGIIVNIADWKLWKKACGHFGMDGNKEDGHKKGRV